MSELDNSPATDSVAPTGAAPEPTPPAAETTAAPAAAPTEAPQGEQAPANPEGKQPPAEEPEWFKQRIKQITRQRRESERRADRLAAELESIKRAQVPRQPQSAELRPQDFTNYDAFVEAKIEAKTNEKIEALNRSRAEQDAHRSAQSLQA